jgi:hypothetical protein
MTIRRIERITIELEPGEPIHGRLLDGGQTQSFHGWLELSAALERARQRGGEQPQDPASCRSSQQGDRS